MDEKKVGAALKEHLQDQYTEEQREIGIPVDLYREGIDLTKTTIIGDKLPIGLPGPYQVVDLSKAYENLQVKELKGRDKPIIIKHLEEKIDNFQSGLERALEGEDELEIDICRRKVAYTSFLQQKAVTLADRLISIEEISQYDFDEEAERYEKKLRKLKENKEREIKTEIEKKGAVATLVKIAKGSLVPITAIATFVAADSLISSYTKETYAAVASVSFAAMIGLGVTAGLDYLGTRKINKIVRRYEPLFKRADNEYRKNKEQMDILRLKNRKSSHKRARRELVRELARYFPGAVNIVADENPAQIDERVKRVTEGIDSILEE